MTDHQGFSRRKFLKGVGVGALAAGALSNLQPDVKARQAEGSSRPPGVFGPGPVAVTLDVNGEQRSLEVEPRVTLLDALRNRLQVTGPKKVCDRASCGACTVLLDGEPVYACTVLAIAAQGRKIETVESLAGQDGKLSSLQQAFVRHDAQQCGFCTSGFVMASEALLRANPAPTEREVKAALGGNLCRCGTYRGITRAVQDAAREDRR